MTTDKKQRKIVAVVGKGGAGKTAVAAMIAGAISRICNDARTLLIDADPAGGLAFAAGVDVNKTIGEVREDVIRQARKKDPVIKEKIANSIDYYVLESLIEKPRFSLLAMGRGETAGCFCPVNSLLREAIEALSKDFDRIIIDGEAGIEQIMRQVMRAVDTLLVVSDTSYRGLNTVSLIQKLVEEKKLLKSPEIFLVLNRVTDVDLANEAAKSVGLDPIGMIPDDPTVREWDAKSKPLYDLPPETESMKSVQKFVEKIFMWDKNKEVMK